jgi:hypothetical protein
MNTKVLIRVLIAQEKLVVSDAKKIETNSIDALAF